MILITGASSGIGEVTALAYARDGKPLILWARRANRLEAVQRKCLELGAKTVHTATLDVRDRAAISSELSRYPELYSETTILVNNAGLARGLSSFQDAAAEDLDEMVDTNVKGFLNVTQAVLPFFLRKNAGHLVHLGSVAGRLVYPKGHVYCATKAAVRALTEGIRLDLSGKAIRVTEIAPGMVETEFSEVRLRDSERAKTVYQGMTPLRAEDIADAILWATSRPPHVNIQEIVIYPVDQASPTVVARK
jgi:NADP-dependent 3-hydroxy acid dehydrogenase YdfG